MKGSSKKYKVNFYAKHGRRVFLIKRSRMEDTRPMGFLVVLCNIPIVKSDDLQESVQ